MFNALRLISWNSASAPDERERAIQQLSDAAAALPIVAHLRSPVASAIAVTTAVLITAACGLSAAQHVFLDHHICRLDASLQQLRRDRFVANWSGSFRHVALQSIGFRHGSSQG